MTSYDTAQGNQLTPVYIPWPTFTSALENLRTHGIPGTGKLDKSLWDTQSGAIQGQIVLAFRFLGLIDEKNQVQPSLPSLVSAPESERKAILKSIIEDKYRNVLSRDLTTISQGQLDEVFRAYNINGSTHTRAVRFFVKACQELGIPISKRVSDKVRSAASSPRKARRNGNRREREGEDSQVDNLNPPNGQNPKSEWEEKLLDKFPQFDPSWPDEIKTKWFAGFDRLMTAKPTKG